jgi:hypothetical protein
MPSVKNTNSAFPVWKYFEYHPTSPPQSDSGSIGDGDSNKEDNAPRAPESPVLSSVNKESDLPTYSPRLRSPSQSLLISTGDIVTLPAEEGESGYENQVEKRGSWYETDDGKAHLRICPTCGSYISHVDGIDGKAAVSESSEKAAEDALADLKVQDEGCVKKEISKICYCWVASGDGKSSTLTDTKKAGPLLLQQKGE